MLIERALGASCGPDTVARAADDIIGAFDGEILNHFEFEEQVLFPMCEQYEELAAIVSELRAEHSQILTLPRMLSL